MRFTLCRGREAWELALTLLAQLSSSEAASNISW